MAISATKALQLGAALTPVFTANVPVGSPQSLALQMQQQSLAAGIQAEAVKKAAKKNKKGTPWGQIIGTAGAVAAAPFTGGASLAFLPMAAGIGSTVDSAIAGDWGGAAMNAAGAAAAGFGGAGAMQGAGQYPYTIPGTPLPERPYSPSNPPPGPSPALSGDLLGTPTGLQLGLSGGSAAPTGGMQPLGNNATTAKLALGGMNGADFSPTQALSLGMPQLAKEEGFGPATKKVINEQRSSANFGENPMHPSARMVAESYAKMNPRDLRSKFSGSPVDVLGAMEGVKLAYDAGLSLNKRQIRAIPIPYRKELRKRDIPLQETMIEKWDKFVVPAAAGLGLGSLASLGNDENGMMTYAYQPGY